MKRTLLLALTACLIAGCGDGFNSILSTATPTPAPTPRPTPATPKPGDWMFKGYQNPLNQKAK